MDFDGLFTDPYQSSFDDPKPTAKLSDQLAALDTGFNFTPSALSEIPCDLGSLSQLSIPEPVKKTEERPEHTSLLLTNPFDDLGLALTVNERPGTLAPTLTAQASFSKDFLQDSLDAAASSSISQKLMKKPRFQPYENKLKEPLLSMKKIEGKLAEEYKNSDEYRLRRDKNNEAVRKSRAKAKQKSKETEDTVQQLREENTDLKRSLEDLQNQLDTLKTLLTSQAE